MLSDMLSNATANSPVASVIISIALMLFLAFLMTRITKLLHLPNVTAYILTGIIIGPYCLNLIPERVINGMEFLPDIALAFISFSTGEFFKLSALKKNGVKVLIITLFESLTAGILVFLLMFFVLKLNLPLSLVFASLACATAPASTLMIIRQTGAKGDFVDTLLQVIALDNVFSLLFYSIALNVASTMLSGQKFAVSGVFKTILLNAAVFILGGFFGFILKCLIRPKRTKDNRLIVSVAILFAFCGICALADVSPLLGCMGMGTVYMNMSNDDKLFKQLNYFSPPILLLFFVRSGLSFKLDAMFSKSAAIGGASLLTIGICYFVVRIIGKYAGAFTGCTLARKDQKIRQFLGLALIPQAGVSIGLAALGARTLGGAAGDALQTVILSSGILYELVGPACANLSLLKTKSYSTKLEEVVSVPAVDENGQPKTSLELLIERINTIQKELPEHTVDENEQAFTNAAEEHYEMQNFRGRRGFRR